MRRPIVLGAAIALLLAAGASAAPIPETGRERTVACLAHLLTLHEGLTSIDDGEEDTADVILLILLKIGVWLSDAESQPDYDADRMTDDVVAFAKNSLGGGEGAISEDEQIANTETCVNEAPELAAP